MFKGWGLSTFKILRTMKKEKIIESFLMPYKKNVQFLQSFQLVGQKGIGKFKINSQFYSVFNEGNHFTAAELQISLNQLLYIYFAYMGLFDYVEQENIEHELLSIQKENSFITEETIHFRKAIEAEKEIMGEIEIVRSKRVGDVSFFECDYNFEKNCFGVVKIVLKDKRNKSIEHINKKTD
jgi:hypothetical protein